MLAVHVHCRVKPESVEHFVTATLANARASLEEPGILRFDVLRQDDDPTRFVLVEVYRTPQDPARHKETSHYAAWREEVADMMAEPRSSVRFTPAFPLPEAAWVCDPASADA